MQEMNIEERAMGAPNTNCCFPRHVFTGPILDVSLQLLRDEDTEHLYYRTFFPTGLYFNECAHHIILNLR